MCSRTILKPAENSEDHELQKLNPKTKVVLDFLYNNIMDKVMWGTLLTKSTPMNEQQSKWPKLTSAN